MVEPFVKERGDKINYGVTMEEKSATGFGRVASAWLEAAGQKGIPCSFIIDRTGKIAWIGQPMTMEPVLKQVIAGTLDAKKTTEQVAQRLQFRRELMDALNSGKLDQALKLMDNYEQQHPESSAPLSITRFQVLLEKKDYDAAYK